MGHGTGKMQKLERLKDESVLKLSEYARLRHRQHQTTGN